MRAHRERNSGQTIMAAPCSLMCIPGDLSEKYLPYELTLRQRQRADLFSREQYFQRVKLQQKENLFEIDARCFRSQQKTDDPHRVHVSVDAVKKTATEAYCTCKAGVAGECAHVLGLIFTVQHWILQGLKDVPADAACTSLPQQWGKPRGLKIEPEPVSTIVICKPGNVKRKRLPLMADFNDNRKNKLTRTELQDLSHTFKGTPIGYLVQGKQDIMETDNGSQFLGSALAVQIPLMQPTPEPAPDGCTCGDLNLPHSPFITIPDVVSNNRDKWIHLQITHDQAQQTERETQDQTSSKKWHQERGKRMTASTFGRYMTRKACISEKFLHNIFCGKAFTSAATSYGTCNERIARQMYIKSKQTHVHDCGLVINPDFPYLGASPDGKVCEQGKTGILEIKCPFSARDMTVQEAVEKDNDGKFFMEMDGSSLRLKRNHMHWFQVQGQLLVTGAAFCDFVTFTRHDLYVERILPDNCTMNDMLEKLTSIYTDQVRKFLEKKQTDSGDSPVAC